LVDNHRSIYTSEPVHTGSSDRDNCRGNQQYYNNYYHSSECIYYFCIPPFRHTHTNRGIWSPLCIHPPHRTSYKDTHHPIHIYPVSSNRPYLYRRVLRGLYNHRNYYIHPSPSDRYHSHRPPYRDSSCHHYRSLGSVISNRCHLHR